MLPPSLGSPGPGGARGVSATPCVVGACGAAVVSVASSLGGVVAALSLPRVCRRATIVAAAAVVAKALATAVRWRPTPPSLHVSAGAMYYFLNQRR